MIFNSKENTSTIKSGGEFMAKNNNEKKPKSKKAKMKVAPNEEYQ